MKRVQMAFKISLYYSSTEVFSPVR